MPVELRGSRGTCVAGVGGRGARPRAATALPFLGPLACDFAHLAEGVEEAPILEPAIEMGGTMVEELGAAAGTGPWTTWLLCHFHFTPSAEEVGAVAGTAPWTTWLPCRFHFHAGDGRSWRDGGEAGRGRHGRSRQHRWGRRRVKTDGRWLWLLHAVDWGHGDARRRGAREIGGGALGGARS